MKEKKYDIVAVAFSRPSLDARLINILRGIGGRKSVCVFGLDDKDFFGMSKELNCKYIPAEVCLGKKNQRMLGRLVEFGKFVKQYRNYIKADIVLAADFYSLPTATGFKTDDNLLLYDSREIYSGLGSLHNAPIKQFALTRVEKHYIKRVDEVIVSASPDAEYLKKHFKHNLPYHVLMNVPPERKPVESEYIRKEFKIVPESRVILYQGALINGRGIYKTVEATKKIDNAVAVIFGVGPEEDNLRKKIEDENLYGKIILGGSVPYDKLHEVTCSADLGIAFFEPVSKSYELALPNKLFEYISAGIPVLASNLPAIAEVFKEYKIGSLLPSDTDIDTFATEIEKLLNNKDSYKAELKRAAERYNYSGESEKLPAIFRI